MLRLLTLAVCLLGAIVMLPMTHDDYYGEYLWCTGCCCPILQLPTMARLRIMILRLPTISTPALMVMMVLVILLMTMTLRMMILLVQRMLLLQMMALRMMLLMVTMMVNMLRRAMIM